MAQRIPEINLPGPATPHARWLESEIVRLSKVVEKQQQDISNLTASLAATQQKITSLAP